MKKIFGKYKKELFLMLGAILLVLSISTYFMHIQATQSLINEHSNKLTSLKNALKIYIEDYFDLTADVVLTLGASETAINAMHQFEYAVKEDSSHSDIHFNQKLLTENIQSFLEQISYDVPQAHKKQPLEYYLSESQNSKILQERYIANNPFSRYQRYKLLDSKTGLAYDRIHKKFHPYFLNELQQYNFYDIFLIDNAGNVIYTVTKEFDFATNILSGAYANSGLASAYKKAINSPRHEVVFEDFKPYEPSYNKPAAFIATSLYDGDTQVGVLAIQLPITQIVKTMTFNHSQEEIGLGKSGESYLVGDDLFMRSDSRFIKTMTDPLVEKFSTTVGITQVNTRAVLQALKGRTSDELIEDYRGTEVYSSYAPVKVFDKNWALLVEIDKQEVLDSARQGTFILLLTSVMIFVIFVTMILFLFIRMILKPMQTNEELLSENLRLQNKALLTSETLLNEYKKAVDLSAIVSKADKQGIITYVNDAFCKVSGFLEDELLGHSHNVIRHPDMPKEVFEELWHTLLNKQVWKGIIKNRKKDGGCYYVNTTIVPILDENGEIQEFMSIRTDITDLIFKEEQILRQTTDPVTLLPNRQQLLEDIGQLMNDAMLASVIINNFRDINDFYGAEVADKVIKNIAAIFQEITLNKAIKLYKITSDGFALFTREHMPMPDFVKIMQNLIDHFDRDIITIDESQFNLSITVGATSGNKTRLFINSEMALRTAIESSKSLMSFEKNSEIEAQYQNNIAMTTKIKNAIKNNGILVFKQLISANKKGSFQKYECLVRMRDNDEIISPFFFLDISKKARLYPTITKIMIERTFEYFSDKEEEFSINFTLEDILADEIVKLLVHKIKQYKIGNRLVIELVESEGIEDYESVCEFITVIKSLGCKIAIDDFGTGYSNFEYLMKLNADYIKIDGSLIKNIHLDKDAEVVVQLIVDFARRMNIKVIAEYVHNQEVQDKIQAMDIDFSQGSFISEPQELT
ncbi:EAL domain-containing protein [Nitrosomonas supralitoralis]|uniref:PAS domain S-box-containing protein/diguanylate cyclase (GGDEF) domain-containing protein n=1 Tax=Nitrosomonas supralitoralis TaxID=2116706 RepID=A0A2P7NWZ6_9PROT|nr:EAL domain-containing protein [Nitrosomonas supralitoralis]PSJ17981.1 hypothetical protein C7H79_05540 [Nitrosomonas supralitoralis]